MYLVTGAAGFIGYHTVAALLRMEMPVMGVDNLDPRSGLELKRQRLECLRSLRGNFTFIQADLTATDFLASSCLRQISHVIHLAAIANPRNSFREPGAYFYNNVCGQQSVLELCRRLPNLKHLVYASSSSVYGNAVALPIREDGGTDKPLSPYATSKKAAEVLTSAYAHAYGIPTTGLRLFSVYGPWSRPDMAASLFARRMLRHEPIRLFNRGNMRRDFTYIEDAVSGLLAAAHTPPRDKMLHRLYNIGSGLPQSLETMVNGLEMALGVKAVRKYAALPPGEVIQTCADITAAARDLNYRPQTDFETGLNHFARWYREFQDG